MNTSFVRLPRSERRPAEDGAWRIDSLTEEGEEIRFHVSRPVSENVTADGMVISREGQSAQVVLTRADIRYILSWLNTPPDG